MKATAAQIDERMPVWEALSEFFLDTELQAKDLEWIANTLASSPYPEKELSEILFHEVYPPCKWNMLSPAGEWAGFHRDWIKEKMSPLYGKRTRILFPFRDRWMFGYPWMKVRRRVSELRSGKKPNKAPEPTSGTVTPRAEPRVVPFPPVAHL